MAVDGETTTTTEQMWKTQISKTETRVDEEKMNEKRQAE